VKILQSSWPKIEDSQDKHSKVDFLLMAQEEGEVFPSALYDHVIDRYSPESYILFIDVKDKLKEWPQSHQISEEVNNIIEILR
jgi:hypothetical protein